MGAALQQLVDALLPFLLAAVPILGAAGLAWLRKKVQVEAAVESATEVELGHERSGPVKKFVAKQRTIERLPWHARPLSEAGLDRLVEKAVPKARVRAAERRSQAPEPE